MSYDPQDKITEANYDKHTFLNIVFMASITNDHKLQGLIQYKYILLQFWR